MKRHGLHRFKTQITQIRFATRLLATGLLATGLLATGLLATSSAEGMVFFYQEPVQYVMAATNPAPAVKPVLDTSGIAEIQSIPVGGSKLYIQGHDTPGYFSMEQILSSIANLTIMQMGLAEFVKFDPDRGEIILEGEFGEALRAILRFNPVIEYSLSVEHTDFSQTDLGKKDCYRLTINYREIDLILRDFAGYDGWGIRGLVLSQYSERQDARGIPYTEYKELLIHQVKDGQNPGKYKFVALYTVRLLAPDGTAVEGEEWEFAQRSPEPVRYTKF